MTESVKNLTNPARRVLIVDDNLDTTRSYVLLLRSMGHEVQYAINGYAALGLARTFRPEVVLLDIGLPDFDGCELAQLIRNELGSERVRILAVTGRSRPVARRISPSRWTPSFSKAF
jgi:DNA-binding response OmpR family regulator